MCSSKYWQEYVQGNNEMLGNLYRLMFRTLFFTAFKYTKNEDVSSDLIHDTFDDLLHMRIQHRKEKWSEIENIDAFLVTLIKCKSLDYLKIKKNRLRIEQEIIYPQTKNYASNELNEELQNLEKLIKTLNLKEQQILHLHLTGYKNEEIAEIQQQSEKSIRNRLSESRTKLRLLWKKTYLLMILLHWIH